MTWPTPYPKHTDLLGDTDLRIRAVAESADRKMSSALQMATLNPTQYRTNGTGDVTVSFPTLTKGLIGAVLYPANYIFINGQTTSIPNPGGVAYIVPARYGWPVIINTGPAGEPQGNLWVRIMVQPYSITANEVGPWAPLEPAGNNQAVTLCGMAWGPA